MKYSANVNCELNTKIVTNRVVQITGNGEDTNCNLSLTQFKPLRIYLTAINARMIKSM